MFRKSRALSGPHCSSGGEYPAVAAITAASNTLRRSPASEIHRCPLELAMWAPELVANGKQPVAMARTRDPGRVHPHSLQVSESLQALAFDPAWAAERDIEYCSQPPVGWDDRHPGQIVRRQARQCGQIWDIRLSQSLRWILAIGARTTDGPKEPCGRVPKFAADAPDPGLHGFAWKRARAERQRT